MARYQVQGPDGAMHIIEGPDNASPADIEAFASKSIPAAAAPAPKGYLDRVKDQVTGSLGAVPGAVQNLTLGAVRGAGSIGATVLAPLDAAARGLGVQNDYIGRDDRRQAMTDATQTLGADPNSLAYKTGKLGGEVAGTAGAGGMLAKGAQGLGAAPEVVNALATNGFSVGNASRLSGAGNLALRSGAGAAAGGAQVGLADPSSAGTGAVIGGILPGALKGVGMAADALGGTPLTAARQASVDTARQAGYTLPPTEIRPNALNSITEGLSGKIKTSQAASQKNQGVTNALAAKALDLPEGTQISHDVLNSVRKQAGQAYEAVGSTGTVTPGPEYTQALDKITEKARTAAAGFPDGAPDPLIKVIDGLKSKQFDAASAVAKISDLRAQADKAYIAHDNELGKGLKAGAGALEDALDAHLQQLGVPPEMLQGFRDARQTIAKTYSVQRGLNNETGDVSAKALAAQLEKGKPLSGELKTIAKVGSAFPKATQALNQNYNALSPLDFAIGAMTQHAPGASVLGSVVGHVAAPLAFPLARAGTRAAILSPAGQNFAARSVPNLNALAGPAAYRSLPRAGQRN